MKQEQADGSTCSARYVGKNHRYTTRHKHKNKPEIIFFDPLYNNCKKIYLNILMNIKLKLSKLKVKSLECTKHYMRKIIMYENLNNCVC